MTKIVSDSCKGEFCFCGQPAEHKVEEVLFQDVPGDYFETSIGDTKVQGPSRHPLTQYICHKHFVMIMGPLAKRPGDE